jgi:hypothetical protein
MTYKCWSLTSNIEHEQTSVVLLVAYPKSISQADNLGAGNIVSVSGDMVSKVPRKIFSNHIVLTEY